jgi:hypothetical protein
MYQLIRKIWTNEITPEDWKWSIICLLHKKGDVTKCSNYRGTSLLCISCKIFSNNLFNRFTPYTEVATGNYQCGYHGGQSTVGQIFTIRQILGKNNEYGKDTHNLFIDFKVAYNRCSLYAPMEEMNTQQKLTALVKATINNTQCPVKTQDRLLEPITIKMEYKGMHWLVYYFTHY